MTSTVKGQLTVRENQIDRFLTALERFATVAERWADVEYPVRNEGEKATMSRVGDRPLPQSKQEYDELPVEEIGRFESKLRT